MMKMINALVKFLWDFFVGETPELFVGALLVGACGWTVHHWWGSPGSVYLLPAAVGAVMAWSLDRARRR